MIRPASKCKSLSGGARYESDQPCFEARLSNWIGGLIMYECIMYGVEQYPTVNDEELMQTGVACLLACLKKIDFRLNLRHVHLVGQN